MLGKGRLEREKQTVQKMIKIYCDHHHGQSYESSPKEPLCKQCQELYGYAMERLSRCTFGADKPTCGNCTVHCYKRNRREEIIAVMRYAGPRMIRHHPVLAIQHLIDGRKK
ncbi:nitrous oxide-stimulated promoter family protein [Heliorestis acidaminivorans]|uniref:Nitrous oxide-stimulated promoter family protein n=1 Tax=Heliorestis acidaminivorans TaxID=553427 RepID=A0A6I0EX65_9FIRM|nr:nitrous oxide-stimulated promoter family protein [Heliorestis acidaminivorans]KAB2951784.1 nitrous oxide-stimulated promoter family protein [Heliorestis acidaminivorans]